MSCRILICDDREAELAKVEDAIEEAGVKVEVWRLGGNELKNELIEFFKHVGACLEAPEGIADAPLFAFDQANLGLFDNNLAHLDIAGARLTAESIVGYVRAFTTLPYSVSLNKNPDVDFDLRYLIGDYDTRADLAVNTDHLSNVGLWTRSPGAEDRFLPWYWPRLVDAHQRRAAQIRFVKDHWSTPVMEALGLSVDADALPFLSFHARGALTPDAIFGSEGSEGVRLDAVRFEDVFLAQSRSLPSEERRALGAALDPLDASHPLRDVAARVVAADLDLWFRGDIVGPQETLVDVPHLLLRMPFLLGDRASDISEWNATLREAEPPFGMEPALYDEFIAPARFAAGVWTLTPCFKWSTLKANEKLNELFYASEGPETWADAVFCEDVSEFHLREGGGPGPREFQAEFEGPWAVRHVLKIPRKQYKPLSRFGGES